MNRFGKILLSTLFVAFITTFGIYMFFTKDLESSKIENRNLAQKPELTFGTLKSGSFMEDFEAYFTDQFPGRNRWLNSYTNYQRLTGRTFISNYYITNDDWMIPKPGYGVATGPVKEATDNLNELSDFLDEKDIELYYFSTPHKISVMQFLLPDYIKHGSYQENIAMFMNNLQTDDNFIAVDMTTEFLNNYSEDERKELYFKTDHHWNMNGAFEGYKRIVDTLSTHSEYFMGTEVKEEDYEKVCIDPSLDFVGSYNNQIYSLVDESDEVKCFPKSKNTDYNNYHVFLNGEEKNPYDVYAVALKEKEEFNYSQLFTDNVSEIKIINDQLKEQNNKILIIKDSYANAMVYQIAEHFYETTIYDPRYNTEKIIMDYIEENDFDVVAFLYNSTHLSGQNYKFDTYPVEE